MTAIVDLMGAARGAVFRALSASVPPELCQVFDDIPQGTEPNYLKLGTLDTENDESKGDQFERLTVEVFAVYRGADRGVLIAMMFAGRTALDRQKLPNASGAQFLRCRFVKGVASDASPQDGVTYAGLMHFEIWAEPA
jgi:hypothetical protein